LSGMLFIFLLRFLVIFFGAVTLLFFVFNNVQYPAAQK
jgi:hypothetical protein